MRLNALYALIKPVFIVTIFVGIHLQEPLCAQTMSSNSYWATQSWMRGGAGVAWSDELDAISSNPALLFRSRGKTSFGGNWMHLPRDLTNWSVGVSDGRTPVVGGIRFDWAEEGNVSRKTVHTSAAYQTSYGSIGASVNTHHFSGLQNSNGWKFSQTVGLFIPIAGGISIGAMGKNLLDREKDSILPKEIATGLSYQYQDSVLFSFQADRRFSIPDQDFSYSFGLDIMTQKFFAIRGGYRMDNESRRDFWSAGLALEAPRSSFAGFYTRTVKSPTSQGFGFKAAFSY